MRALTAWLKATLDYNPTFPISALLLMGGVYRLLAPHAQAPEGTTVAATAAVIVSYELVLVGLALFLLWPRRIVYETTSLLIIEGVIRFAPAVTVLLLDPRQNLGTMLLLGVGTAGLLALRAELIARKTRLDARPWERAHAIGTAALATVGFPLLARQLLTAGGSARPLGIVAVALVAVALAPGFLGLGRGPLRRERALGSRLPVVVARGLDAASIVVLLLLALWVNDVRLDGGAFAPLLLLAALGVTSIARAIDADGELALTRHLLLVPGVVAAAIVALPADVTARFGSHGLTVGVTLVLAIALARLFQVRHAGLGEAWLGERATLVAASAAPLRVLPTQAAQAYGAGVLVLGLAFSFTRRLEKTFTALAVGATVAATWAHPRGGVASLLEVVPLAAGALAVAAAIRFPSGPAGRVARAAAVGSSVVFLVNRGQHGLALDDASASALLGLIGVAVLALRTRTRASFAAVGLDLALLVGPQVAQPLSRLGDGVLLVGLAFLALPLGCVVALRREGFLGRSAGEPATSSPR